MPNTFTITSIDREKGHVTVVYSVDGVSQTMCDAPLNDAEALKAFLIKYGARYEKSLLESAKKITPKVEEKTKIDAIIGETFPVSA